MYNEKEWVFLVVMMYCILLNIVINCIGGLGKWFISYKYGFCILIFDFKNLKFDF